MEDIHRADDDRRFGVAETAVVITTFGPTRTIGTAVIDICLEELVQDTMNLTGRVFEAEQGPTRFNSSADNNNNNKNNDNI